jgi:serine phosphatase RsbU (regulator of sigma subunit)
MPGRRIYSALVVIALLIGTGVAAALAYDTERDEAREADETRARQAALAARQSVTGLVAGLKGSNALVAGGAGINPDRFESFAADVLRRTPFSGLALSPVVSPEEREEFEAEYGAPVARIGSDGSLRPLPGRVERESLPIALIYPDDPTRRRELIGFDLLSDPARAAVARRAIRTEASRLSPPVELADPPRPGAVLLDPVIDDDGDLAGILSTGVEGDAIAATVADQLALAEGVSITDSGDPLTAMPPADSPQAEVGILGRRWIISVPGETEPNLTPAIAFGAGGLALTLAAAGLLLLASRRERDLVVRQDETERLAARETLHVRITEAIEREIEGDARLGSLARQLVPAVGDICVVHEATPRGGVRRVGVAAPDERITELIQAMPEPPSTSPVLAAISSRQPVLYTRISEDREARRARERGIPPRPRGGEGEPTAVDLLAADQLSSMIVPLVARNRVLGTLSITVLASSGRPPLTREDLAFAMEVATHAAVALDNARLYEQQRDIAGILQGALVPRELIQVPGADVAARHRAGMTGTEVGGDFYDLFEVGGHWMAVLGDVCGKGPQAAALTALARHTVRATARLGPAGAVGRVHDAIRASGELTYCTLCCAELRPTRDGLDATVTTAGHPEPWIIEPDGSLRRLEVTGPLVGAFDAPSFAAQDLHLERGALLFICSDGLPEARRNGEVFGDHRLGALLSALASESPDSLLERLEEEILRFVQGSPRDDLAMFALRVA